MGIFSRARDIVTSNISAMLDKAEDPEKLIKLIIQEMEDTLIEVKASCAGVMADQKRIRRHLDQLQAKSDQWVQRAEMAVSKGYEDLAKEALVEKRRLVEQAETFESELHEAEALIDEYQKDILQLEEKLSSVKERQRMLIKRHTHAGRRKKAQKEIRRVDNTDAIARFEAFENRIERMESEADLVNFGRKPSLEERFSRLAEDEDIEMELAALKGKADAKNKQTD